MPLSTKITRGGFLLKLEFSLPDFALKFKQMQSDIMLVLAATMQTNRSMMFDKDGADNGKPSWAPLVLRAGRPLQDTGTLRKSLAPINDGIRPNHGKDGIVKIQGYKATIGTELLYAGVMNDGTTKMPGGVLKPVHALALKIPLPAGGFMFRKSVRIPARAMDIITDQDKKEWGDTLANYISERLNG